MEKMSIHKQKWTFTWSIENFNWCEMEVHEKDHFAVGYVGCSGMEVKCSLVKIISPCKNHFPCNESEKFSNICMIAAIN